MHTQIDTDRRAQRQTGTDKHTQLNEQSGVPPIRVTLAHAQSQCHTERYRHMDRLKQSKTDKQTNRRSRQTD